MADVENAPLLGENREISSAAAPPTWVQKCTLGVFAVAAFIAIINLFYGPFFGTLVYEVATLSLAYYILVASILPKGGPSFSMDTALAYVACGLAPATLLVMVSSIAGSVLVLGPVLFTVILAGPQWLQTIFEAAKTMDRHGGIDVKEAGAVGMRKVFFTHGRRVFSRNAVAHVVRIGATAAKASNTGWDDLAAETKSDSSFAVPHIVFKDDGTNAGPVVASILRAISSISPLFLLCLLAVCSYVLQAFITEFVMFWLIQTRPMAREGATLRTVTASALAIALGYSVAGFVLLGDSDESGVFGAVVGAAFFPLLVAFEMALIALIAIQLVQSRDQNPSDSLWQAKNALYVPVLLKGTVNFLPGLALIGAIKVSLPVVADILEAGKGDATQVMRALSWVPLCVFIVLAELVLFLYSIRLARKRFDDATEEAVI